MDLTQSSEACRMASKNRQERPRLLAASRELRRHSLIYDSVYPYFCKSKFANILRHLPGLPNQSVAMKYSSGCLSFGYNPDYDVVHRTLDFLGLEGYAIGTDGNVWSCWERVTAHPVLLCCRCRAIGRVEWRYAYPFLSWSRWAGPGWIWRDSSASRFSEHGRRCNSGNADRPCDWCATVSWRIRRADNAASL
jgi:hypothetical protein